MTLPSKLIKACLIAAPLFLAPMFAHAATFAFNNQTWEIAVQVDNYTPQLLTRNDGDLAILARAVLFGQTNLPTAGLFAPTTIKEVMKLPAQINQQSAGAELTIENKRATHFIPGQNGQALDLYALRQQLLADGSQPLPVLISEPTVKLASTNILGINELVAIGESNFSGSPRNRIHNIAVGADKFDGLIVAPGQEFSFNKYLGDVDAEHGFLPELVIKPGGVTPEFGGGLCQVSSTTFRAAMNAGLPITARRNHSFAVQYYAPQGTDATIYPGSADLKFINDLPTSLLIHTKIVGRKLYFEFYGTKDSRTITFDGPTQYDKKPDGSMKATWTKHVTKNGQLVTQVFKSTYLPPALFHRDAVEQPSTPNPETPTTPITPPLTQ